MPIVGSYRLGYVAPLVPGDAGTAQTIRAIRGLVDDAWRNAEVNRCAIDIVRDAGADQYDDNQKARALFNWAMANMYFVNDPWTKEALRPTVELLKLRAGDCDDINAILLPSLMGSLGIETRLVTIASNPQDPEAFSHIYAEACIDGEWIPIDAARPGTTFGSAPPHFFKRWAWSLTGDDHWDYPGQGQLSGYRRPHGQPRLALGLAGVGDDVTSVLDTLASQSGQIAAAVNGNPVINVVGSAIGPGGTQMITQGNPYGVFAQSWFDQPSAISGVSNGEFLVGGAVLFFGLTALMKRGKK